MAIPLPHQDRSWPQISKSTVEIRRQAQGIDLGATGRNLL
jgi:hypothetical protein